MSEDKYIFGCIPVDISNVEGLKFNTKKYKNGIEDASYYAGIITGLLNTGLDEEYVPTVMTSVLNNLLKQMITNG